MAALLDSINVFHLTKVTEFVLMTIFYIQNAGFVTIIHITEIPDD